MKISQAFPLKDIVETLKFIEDNRFLLETKF